ncbi:hypothetical protein [Azospirillum tabaci]|uniref:hypothetical protein n=1 Tax=Azospirillum tabaci TaxID=2752310 RepID=UPI001660598D|nr:hypothetical protein [Azospirillum tabaci]
MSSPGSSRRQGRQIIHSVDAGRFQALLSLLTENCCQGNADLCPPRPGGCTPDRD